MLIAIIRTMIILKLDRFIADLLSWTNSSGSGQSDLCLLLKLLMAKMHQCSTVTNEGGQTWLDSGQWTHFTVLLPRDKLFLLD